MKASERKQLTEDLLKKWKFPVFDNLPPLEEENDIRLRSPQEVAERVLILTYLNCSGLDKSLRQEVVSFLKNEGLWEKASDQEKVLFEKYALTEEDITNIAWRAESIWLLLWTMNKVNQLDLPVEEVNIPDIFEHLPPFMQSTSDFIHSANIRSIGEILDHADMIFRLNWAIHHAEPNDSNVAQLSHGIVYERYMALNWTTGLHEKWDE